MSAISRGNFIMNKPVVNDPDEENFYYENRTIDNKYIYIYYSNDLSQERLNYDIHSIKGSIKSNNKNQDSYTNGSYSNIFLKKKEKLIAKNGGMNENSLSYIRTNESGDDKINEDRRQNKREYKFTSKKPPTSNNSKERNVNNTKFFYKAKSNNSSSDYISNISQEKYLSPKTNYNFQNEYVIKDYSKPSDSINSEKSIKSSFNETGQTSVHLYLQRRHTESQQKLLRLKNEQIQREKSEVKDRPTISKNSKKIVERLVNNKMDVFDRLTSKKNEVKKQEEISKIIEITNKHTNKPNVNLI